MVFQELKKESVKETEQRIAAYWETIDILKRTIETREGNENFVFYEGPPTANGNPGIHHVLARTLKDSVNKYKTMQGYRVLRKAGWDTHGLPVEIEVEKSLGMSGKGDIEKYGIQAFNQKCKDSVFTYEAKWREMTKRMAYFVDMDHPYITLDNHYIETVWWILKEFFKKGMLYEGHKILPYCPRCGTGLASHEVAQGYQMIKTDTVYVTFKRKDKDEYFLVWTTTPWTLASNVALAVHPDLTYVKVQSKGNVFILYKGLVSKIFGDDAQIIEECKGSDLEYVEYEQLMPFVQVEKKAFFVTLADYVTTEDGTGIVHIAPAFGEDDYQVGLRYDLPVVNPVDESGHYTTTPWKGRFVIDADKEIIPWLKEQGVLFRKQRMEHNYPHCWRCKTPLLYYAKPSWYIRVTDIKEELIQANNAVQWYPDFVGEKRFGNWLENLKDWAISRSRYWGTPLNLWRCSCGHVDCVGSIEELCERAVEDVSPSIELHRPFVDDVHLRCEKCGKLMTRVPDVIDCWFDSGSMPFAQQHYPFENQQAFSEQFPADFICEGIDQTRGWFYSLLAISVFLKGCAPYKRVLVNDLILDKEGRKMSKSRGNTVDPFVLFDQYGADALRWYLLYVSPAWTPTRFDEDGLKEVISKFFSTFKNIYSFFALYANTDNIDPRTYTLNEADLDEIDVWLLSKFQCCVRAVNENMAQFDLTKTVKVIQDFVSDDFSNWYIRRNRRRFWQSECNADKKAVFSTTYTVLVELCKLAAPFAPFICEEIYRNLTGEESVHLANYPVSDASKINETILERMDTVRTLVSLGRAAREEVSIKVRQPLSKIIVEGKYQDILSGLDSLIKEELNIKEIEFTSRISEYMDFTLKLNFKLAGPILGSKVKAASQFLNTCDAKDVLESLDQDGKITFESMGESITLDRELLDVRIHAKEGFNAQMQNGMFVILDTELDAVLLCEGYARELVSKVQNQRKASGFQVTDRISLKIDADDTLRQAFTAYKEFICKETLCDALSFVSLPEAQSVALNDAKIKFSVEKC